MYQQKNVLNPQVLTVGANRTISLVASIVAVEIADYSGITTNPQAGAQIQLPENIKEGAHVAVSYEISVSGTLDGDEYLSVVTYTDTAPRATVNLTGRNSIYIPVDTQQGKCIVRGVISVPVLTKTAGEKQYVAFRVQGVASETTGVYSINTYDKQLRMFDPVK